MRNPLDPGTAGPLAVVLLLCFAVVLSLNMSIIGGLWDFARAHPDKYISIGLITGFTYAVLRGHAKIAGLVCVVGFISLFIAAMIFEGALAFFDALHTLSAHLDQGYIHNRD